MKLGIVSLVASALVFAFTAQAVNVGDLEKARDRQDRTALDKMVSDARSTATANANDADAQYRLALASSFEAEVDAELKDKPKARAAAESGMQAAEKAVALKGDVAEYHRILGTLCGQMISSAGLQGLRYGKCALDSVNKAIELDPKSSEAYVSHGVGNYYLPQALGGGVELAIKDFQKATELNPKSADAYLWLGIAQRKANRNAEARKALEKSVQLDPNRNWAKEQLAKTPAQ